MWSNFDGGRMWNNLFGCKCKYFLRLWAKTSPREGLYVFFSNSSRTLLCMLSVSIYVGLIYWMPHVQTEDILWCSKGFIPLKICRSCRSSRSSAQSNRFAKFAQNFHLFRKWKHKKHINPRPTGGGQNLPPLANFCNSVKTAARSAAKISVPVAPSILRLPVKFEQNRSKIFWVISKKVTSLHATF